MKPKTNALSSRFHPVATVGCSGIAAILICTAGTSHAQTSGTWNSNSTGNWSDPTKWLNSFIADGAGSNANFNANLTGANKTVTLDTPRTIGTLTIGDNSTSDRRSFTISGGNILTFNNNGTEASITQRSSSNGDTISSAISLLDSLDITNSSTSRTLTLSTGGISAGSLGTKTISILGTTTGGVALSGPITVGSGDIAIVKGNANNNLTLSGANNFTGGVTLNAGTLTLNSATSLGATGSTLTINGGTLAGNATISNVNAQNWNSDFSFGGTSSFNTGAGAVTLSANREVTITGSGIYTVGGAIGDGGGGFSLTTANSGNTSTGILGLSGTNTYTGGTNINGGVVRFNSAAAIPATGVITIQDGGALSVSGARTTLATWLGTAALSSSSTGALSLAGASSSENFDPGASGFNTVSLGSNVGNTATYTGTYTASGSGYFAGGGGGTIIFDNTNAFTGAGNLTVGNGGGGTVVLAKDNNFTGTTVIGASGTLQVGNGGATGSLSASTITNNGIFAVNRGSGDVAVNIAITGTGSTVITRGGVLLGVDNALVQNGLTLGGGGASGASSTAGTLNMGAFNQTVTTLDSRSSNTADTSSVIIGSGKQLTVTETANFGQLNVLGVTNKTAFTGDGTLALTGTTVNVGLANSSTINLTPASFSTLDVTGLGEFSTDVTNFNVGVGFATGGSVLLSNTSNSVVATTLTVSDSFSSNAGSPSSVTLGAGTNVIQADSINIGVSKSNGTVAFASQVAGPGTVTITNKAGTGGADITIGNRALIGTGAATAGTLDLRGHTANVTAGTVILGQDNTTTTSTNAATGTIFFDAGTFTVQSLQLGNKLSSVGGNAAGAGILNIGGGNFTVDTGGLFRLAQRSGSGGFANGTVNITGGTLTTNVDITDGGQVNSESTINLDGGTLDLLGNNIGAAGSGAINTLTLASGTLQNVGEINGGGAITKTTGGTLTLSGTNTYTGATTVSEGKLLVGSSVGSLASLGLSAVDVSSGATLGGHGTINGSTTINNSGILSVGSSAGSLEFAGNLTISGASASTVIELGGTNFNLNVAEEYDRVKMTGLNADVLTLDGTLDVSLLSSYTLAANEVYGIFQLDGLATRSGTFVGLANDGDLVGNFGGQDLYITYSANVTDSSAFLTGGNDIALYTIPEPSTAMVLLGGLGLLIGRRRR